MRRRLVGRVRSMRVAAATASIMRLALLPAVRSFTALVILFAVGSEVLQGADPRIEGDHGRLALVADQERRDQAADLLDLRQDAFHVRVGLQADHQRDRLVRHIDVDVLLLAVIEQVELVGLQPVHVVSVAVEDQHRRLHHLDAAAEYGGRLGRNPAALAAVRLLAVGQAEGRTEK